MSDHTLNFDHLYSKRREVWRLVQQSQKRESEVMRQVSNIALKRKEQVLLTLSRWLLKLSDAESADRDHWKEMEAITGLQFDEWFDLRRKKQELEKQHLTAVREEKAAWTAFSNKSPFGSVGVFVSGFFVDEKENQVLRSLESAHRHANVRQEAIKTTVEKNQEAVRVFGEQFLRSCLSNLARVQESQAVGAEITSALNTMAEEIANAWTAHATEEQENIRKVEEAVAVLKATYAQHCTAFPGGIGKH